MQYIDKSELAQEPALSLAPIDMNFHEFVTKEEVDPATGLSKPKDVLEIRPECKGKLITSLDELREYAEKCRGKDIAVDTETTGICYRDDYIVGVSIAYDKYYTGIYIPIRHQIKQKVEKEEPLLDENGEQKKTKTGKLRVKKVKTFNYSDSPYNLPAKEVLDLVYQIMLDANCVFMHNSEFDLNMFKKEGYDVMKVNTFDTIILPYLYDSEGKNTNGLKFLERRLLGRIVPEFKDALGGETNFQYTDPTLSYSYACYDKETDVLTENGWVNWQDYNGVDKLATINIETELLEYQSPTKLYKYMYKGKMECCVSQALDYCVTPNHNMVVARAQNPDNGWLFKRADSLNAEETTMIAPRNFKGGNTTIEINGNKYDAVIMAKLAALIIADGCIRTKNKNHRGYEIVLSTCKDKNYKEIESILLTSPFNWHSYPRKNNMVEWGLNNKDLWEWLEPYAGHGSLNKRVPKEIFELTKEAIDGFLQAYSWTDGYNYPTGAVQYYSISPYIVDGLQHLLMLVGKRSSVYTKQQKDSCINGRTIKAENCHPIYYIKITSERTKRIKKTNRFQTDYNDYVYCAEVPNHTLITRRNLKTMVAGNCFDATGTYGVKQDFTPLVNKLLDRYQEVIKIDGIKYNVMKADNNLIRSFVDYYNHAILQVDKQVAIDYKEKIMSDLAKTKDKIFSYFGKPFNLSKSSNEFKAIMAEFNINTGAMTDTGRISFGDEGLKAIGIAIREIRDIIENHQIELEFLDNKLAKNNIYGKKICDHIETYGVDYFKYKKGTNFGTIYDKDGNSLTRTDFLNTLKKMLEGETKKKEILEAIKDYGSLMKALNSYIDKLTQVDSCRMRYRLQSTASGRLSSGNSERSSTVHNNYYIDLNAQNLTKPHSCLYKAEESNEYGNIMGYKFTEVSKEYADEHPDELIVEGAVQTANIRKCIVAPTGVYKIYVQDDNGDLTKKFFRVTLKDGTVFEHVAQCRKGINPDVSVPITKDMVEKVEPLGEKRCREVIVDRFKYLEEYNYIFDEQLQESRYVLSCDYSSEEYIALATLSRDHVMLDNFRNGVDPHTASAWAIYGKENYSKEKRKKAKAFNFANNYGGTKYAIAQLLEISPEEAEQMVESYNKTFWQCDAWKKNEIDKAYNKYKSCAFNVFGRPRQFVTRTRAIHAIQDKSNISLEEIRERERMANNMKASINRRIISHIIQSSCGDICRLDLLKLYSLFFQKRDPHIDFLTTVHDEVNFSVDKSKIIEYARKVEDTMLFPYFDKTLPIKVTIGIGDSLGNVFDFVWADKERTKLVPKHF